MLFRSPYRFRYSASLYVSFHPSLIRSHSCSSGAYLVLSLSVFPLPICFLSSASLPVPATQPSVSSFPFSFRFCLTVASSVYQFLLSLLWFSPLFPTRFPVFSFPVFVLGFLLVSFRPSLIRSHSCSSGAYLMLSLSVFFPFDCFLSSAFDFGFDYSAFRSFFSLLPVFP